MTLHMGVLVSPKRYERLLGGGFETLRLRSLQQELSYDVKSLYAIPGRLVTWAGRGPMIAATFDGWREETVEPLPQLYLNMLAHPSHSEGRALREMNGDPGIILINEVNHWKRQMVYEILKTMPGTQAIAPQIVDSPPSSQPGVYLVAPSRRSLRPEALLWELTDEKTVRYVFPSKGRTGTVAAEVFGPQFEATLSRERMVHLRLPGWPAGPDGSPAEWRIYACRSEESGTWSIGASVAKHDAMRLEGTRERSWQLATGLALAFGERAPALETCLASLALSAVNAIALFIPGISRCALDFWIDSEGHVTLVGLIGRYRTDWLQRTGQIGAMIRLLDHPARFARTLQETGVERIHVDFGRSREQNRG